MNANAKAFAEHLAQHPAVRSVYYPGVAECTQDAAHCRAVQRDDTTGMGCLVSFLLNEKFDIKASPRCFKLVATQCADFPPFPAQAFYDHWQVSKGPSFGMTRTLVCPYTLLAHYTELDWVAQYGVAAELIRVSLGTEPLEVIANFLSCLFSPSLSTDLSVDLTFLHRRLCARLKKL
jgi:cystathionine gamma-synthase